MKGWHDFVIRNDHPSGHRCRLWIDGREAKRVTKINVAIDAEHVTRVTVEYLAGSINADVTAQSEE